MGFIKKQEEQWWAFAVELARRGLWPLGIIEIHGPHAPPANKIWGNVTAASCDRKQWEVGYVGPYLSNPKYSLRGLRFFAEEGLTDEAYEDLKYAQGEGRQVTFPVLKGAALLPRARVWLRYAQKQLHEYYSSEAVK